MKTVGIIVEYNPLHYGHVYHYNESKLSSKADAVVAVMSGNFLQRGEPAIVNKWARAEMALHMGADLVIELPIAFASQPAEWFAYGAVSALDSTGVVNNLCFGSESGEIDALLLLAKRLHQEPTAFQDELLTFLKKGMNYPAAYNKAVQQMIQANPLFKNAPDLALPNNILGLHYLIALERLNSEIKPLTITRQKAGYHQKDITDLQIASATAIRKILLENHNLHEIIPYVPKTTYDILEREWQEGRGPIHWELYAASLYHQLLIQTTQQLSEVHEVNEGLENRIKQSLSKLNYGSPLSFDQLLDQLKTKRYTKTKLQRTLLRILLNHSKQNLAATLLREGVPYLRILGFSNKGRELLKTMKKTAKVPIITKVPKETHDFLELDIRATSAYSLAYPQANAKEIFRDYYQAPIYLSGKEAK